MSRVNDNYFDFILPVGPIPFFDIELEDSKMSLEQPVWHIHDLESLFVFKGVSNTDLRFFSFAGEAGLSYLFLRTSMLQPSPRQVARNLLVIVSRCIDWLYVFSRLLVGF